MADERSETPRPSWRDKGGTTPRPEAGANAGSGPDADHEWTRRGAPGGERMRRPGTRTLRLLTALVAFLSFAGAAIAVIWWIQPLPPAAFVLVGADYATNLAVPQNVAGVEGLRGLESITGRAGPLSLIKQPPVRLLRKRLPLERAEDWNILIEDVVKKQAVKGKETLVFVLAMHGTSDAKDAYLLPNAATKPEDRLKLRDVIASLKKLPEANPKLLVLEPAGVPADWSLGVIHNDFVSRLQELKPEIAAVKNLYVMSASGVDQRCWTSEGLGRSPFFHYLIEGLRGKAAGSNGRLTLDQLYAYVQKNVKDWVWNAREAVQEPLLIKAGSSTGSDVFVASARDAKAPAFATTPDHGGPERAWKKFGELNRLVPHPSAYSPLRWRDYRANLVRYDELTRAGSTQAERMAERLSSLERRIKSDRMLDLPASSENTLAMNAVEGGRVDPASLPGFNTLWTSESDDERAKIWKTLTDAPADTDPRVPSLRIRVDEFLLLRASESPVDKLAATVSRLRLTRGTDFPQPAEAHFVRMVGKYLDTSKLSDRDWALVGKAIKVRKQAELSAVGAFGMTDTSHAYSEQVQVWVKPLVEKADVLRRQGEDQLFATGDQARVEARQALDQAETIYGQADLKAARVREALALRDRLLSELPDYARWVSHRRAGAKPDAGELTTKIESLSARTHDLIAQLEAIGDESKLSPLFQTLSTDFTVLTRLFGDQRADIDLQRTGEDWDVANAAVKVAFADSDDLSLRRTIWQRLDNIREKDQELATRGNLEGSKKGAADPVDRVRKQSLFEGRMALATLGKDWFDATKFQAQGNAAALSKQLADAAGPDESSWRKAVAAAGDWIGLRWQGLRPEINALVTAVDKDPGAASRSGLIEADRWSRLAAAAPAPSADSVVEPATRLRKSLTHDLLVGSARRAWFDHWYDEDPAERPYYQLIGVRYLDDAESLLPGSRDVAAMRTQLKAPAALAFDEPAAQVVTSEIKPAIRYNLVENGEVPSGIPVVRARKDPKFDVDGDGGSFRAISRHSGDQPAQPADFSFSSPLVRQAESDPTRDKPSREQAEFVVEGFLRGQTFERKTPVMIDPVAEIVAINAGPPSPPQASLAVRADPSVIDRFGEGNGSIAFVLDCSGSMVNPSKTKFEEAKQALKAALRTVPRGTRLSIITFGQAGDGFVREFPRGSDNLDRDKPERTIKSLRKPSPWNSEQLEDLNRQLDALQPFHGTPLVQAMWSAKLDLDDAKGFKTMVVLTDGKDTRFTADTDFNPKGLDIPTFIRTYFNKSDVMINMVGFKVVEEELADARRQFASAIEHLDPPGKFFTVQDVGKLVSTLQSAMRQTLVSRLVKGDDGADVGSLDVTSPGEADRWWTKGLAPGAYTLKVAAGRTYSRRVNLETGDRLIVKLIAGPDGGIGFERAVYGDDARSRKEPVAESAGWQFAVLANRVPVGTSRLELMIALEPRAGDAPPNTLEPIPGLGPIRQVKPAVTWFAVEPTEGRGAYQVRWHERSMFPAPVWQVDVPRWLTDPAGVGPDRPVLKAWWLPGNEISAAASLKFDAPFAVASSTVEAVDGSTVVVENIAVEDHLVETRPGAAPETATCLVVRLAYPEGKPFLVDPSRLAGLKAERHEHRLYTTSRKYTGLFWPVSRSQVETNLRGLGLVALDPLRRQAEGKKQYVELKLNRPRTEDRFPEAPAAVVGP